MSIIILILISSIFATFSITAVDIDNAQVGSAGGSCIANSIIISDIHPGHGVIHTQSYWHSANQSYASTLMDEGFSPSEIMQLLEENDISNNSSLRQYGAVDLIDGGRSASYTGENCYDWKGHVNGITYAIQGNILLSEDILNSIESSFVNKQGTLDQKLMAGLQGGNIAGADSRCLDEGISTLSAFIRVANPNDTNTYYMDLNISDVTPYYNQTNLWIDPVDTLQTLYDEWYEQNFTFLHGDINQDEIINILDIVSLVSFILGENYTGIQFYLSDINEDSIINIQDIILLLNYIISD